MTDPITPAGPILTGGQRGGKTKAMLDALTADAYIVVRKPPRPRCPSGRPSRS